MHFAQVAIPRHVCEIRASESTLIIHGAGGCRETVEHNVVGSGVSYLNGLNVTRLLLTIILPSVPPLIILQKEPRLTSSLISQPGSWRRQTFYPCPIQQRSTAAPNSLISPPTRRPGEVRAASLSPRRKWDKVLFSKSPLSRAEMLVQALLRRQANILNKRWSRDRLSRPYIRFKFFFFKCRCWQTWLKVCSVWTPRSPTVSAASWHANNTRRQTRVWQISRVAWYSFTSTAKLASV